MGSRGGRKLHGGKIIFVKVEKAVDQDCRALECVPAHQLDGGV